MQQPEISIHPLIGRLRNKNILFGYKKLLKDLFHKIFWLQKVYQKCITKVKKEPETLNL